MPARIPVATYRIQFTKDFRFADARALIPYFERLGISHIYASPVFAARPGSQHGYDVVDPTRINDELGGREEFDKLVNELHARGMGIVLDIVPNHMAASPFNPWWMDVLENGEASRYASFFGINWSLASEEHGAKIVVPTLGSPYGEVLTRGELQLGYEERGFFAGYFSARFRIGPATYNQILKLRPESLPRNADFTALLERFDRLPPRAAAYWEALESRAAEVQDVKQVLWRLYADDEEVRSYIDQNLRLLNGEKGDPGSFRPLHALLENQAYRLAYWHVATEKINYRRFFDVNELVGIRVDDPFVFQQTHSLIFDLVNSGRVEGLRVDHIDGLFNPTQYLQRLPNDRVYLVVEKILADGEDVPSEWPVQGTSGYEFLGLVNALLTDARGLERLRSIYAGFTGLNTTEKDVAYGRKKKVIAELFAGEIEDLGRALAAIADQDLFARDLSPRALTQALIEVTASMGIYRTYTSTDAVSERDRGYLRSSIEEARRRNPDVPPAVYDFLLRVLNLEFPPDATAAQRVAWGLFVMRWQQISGPITAKGVEDSTYYVYNPLVSLNEVGSIGRALAPDEFHSLMRQRGERWPHAMNATSTHDTKRSEDVRARIAVLSEIPDEWARYLGRWRRRNRDRRTGSVPDTNEEYFIYQNLLGVWPLDLSGVRGLRERLHGYIEKAAREARTYTNWLNPNPDHEAKLKAFIDGLLADERFLADFARLREKVELYGAMKALSQVLLKITAPGVPDFYQGTVGWNLTLVDPDNRRAVEFPKLTDFGAGPQELLDAWRDGRIKVFTTESALAFRRAHQQLFTEGEYIALSVVGKRAENVVAFARRQGSDWALTVVPRLMTKLSVAVRPPVGIRAWRDTEIVLPSEAPQRWRSVFTSTRIKTRDGCLPVHRLLEHFPVALLSGRG